MRNAVLQQNLLRDLSAAAQAGDAARAAIIAHSALSLGMEHPAFFNARAIWAQQEDRHADALSDFRLALDLTPRNPLLLDAVGLCLARLNRHDEAVAAFDAAIRIEPQAAPIHYHRGWTLEAAGRRQAALQAYQQALSLNPDYAEALAGLASISATEGDFTAARQNAEAALRLNPAETTATVALAMAEINQEDFEAAREHLAAMLENPNIVGQTRAVGLGFYADALDGLDQPDEAFEYYTAANEELRRLHESRFEPRGTALRYLSGVASWLESTEPSQWSDARANPVADLSVPRTHVFILGFFRSGTTLLEQILRMNSDVASIEETETLVDSSAVYLSSAEAMQRIPVLSHDALDRARRAYWHRVREAGGEPDGKVFVDKQPLNTVRLPLIRKLFPDAKIVFAIRDPRDAVLSCFRRHFRIDANAFEMLSLNDAAALYDVVMRIGLECREKLGLDGHEYRYESLIENFEQAVRAVCDFIGIDWSDSMRNFSQAARLIPMRSPSASQVRKDLYGDAVGQWRRYRTQLEPVLPVLEPWVDRFGYPLS